MFFLNILQGIGLKQIFLATFKPRPIYKPDRVIDFTKDACFVLFYHGVIGG